MQIRQRRRLGLVGLAWIAAFLCALPSGAQEPAPLRIADDGTTCTVFRRTQPIFRYRHDPRANKPYLDQLFSPAGINILRDAPPDHAHHHGLMFAVGVEGTDFWIETASQRPGRQRQTDWRVNVTSRDNQIRRASIQQTLRWVTADELPLLHERRRIETYQDDSQPRVTLLTWESRLETAPSRERVTLAGDHYFGLGMRFVASMDKVGRFTNSSGQQGDVVRGKERLIAARWCAYTAPAEGESVTVVLFDHPRNPRHPATMFTMPEPFAYLSATLDLSQKPLVVNQGEPLLLRYGVVVGDGELEPPRIEKLYQAWQDLVSRDREPTGIGT